MTVGDDNLGKLARSQLAAARSDPRLHRSQDAVVADYWDAVEEAEQVRTTSIMGLHELQHALEHEERKLGVKREDATQGDARSLQAAWERAELARAAIENEHPHLNAQALVSLNSALDALIEGFVPAMRSIRVGLLVDELLSKAEAEHASEGQLTNEQREALRDAAASVILDKLPKLPRPTGSGSDRYETLLAHTGLAAPADRPIPADMDQTLAELGAIRDVLVHRAGRIDNRAKQQAPSLSYSVGDFVRITGPHYRKYSAAIHCYAAEVIFRSMRTWPNVSDSDGPDLAAWRDYYRLGA